VEGSASMPYQVSITLDEASVLDADCSCPYDWGGACKHIVAALLAYVHEPAFESTPSLADYELIRELTGEDWASLKPQVMDRLRGVPSVWQYDVRSDATLPSAT
jgi:uncharacterized Zn finger protein